MTRREKPITITAAGRDKGKTFLLTEMDADDGEKWAYRALLGLMNAGVDVPPNILHAGFNGVAVMGLNAFGKLKWEVAEPLLDEMFQCVKVIRDPARPDIVLPLIKSDTEEISTRMLLRVEVLSLHLNFSILDELRKYQSILKAGQTTDSSSTQMSPATSAS